MIHDEGNHLRPGNVACILQFRVEHLGLRPHIPWDIHHITHLLHREGGILHLLQERLSLRLQLPHLLRGLPIFRSKGVHLTLQLPQPAQILDGLLYCANQTLPRRSPTSSPTCCICSSNSAIRERTLSWSRIMESTRLSSKVKVDVPPPSALVVNLVRVAKFPLSVSSSWTKDAHWG